MTQIPHDILFTIFSKLPIKSLMRFKCISKQWCSIISSDPCFSDMQMKNRHSEDARILIFLGSLVDCSVKQDEDVGGLFFIINPNPMEIGGRSWSGYYQLQGSCNGLLFFTRNFDDIEVVLYNPLTQEVSAFPCPKPWFPVLTFDVNYGFGFDYLSGKYKIIRFFSQLEDDDSDSWINVAAEISSLEDRGNSWREIENFPRRPFQGRMVYNGGALHCACADEFSGSLILFSFLLDKEEFISSSFPDLLCVHLVEIGEFLGIVDLSSRSKIEIWVQKELRGEWIKEYKIDITAPEGIQDNGLAEVIGIWKNDEMLLSPYPNSFVLYNRESDTLKFVELPTMEYLAGIVSLRGSLVSVSRVCRNNEDF